MKHERTYTWDDLEEARGTIASLSGLEVMQAVAEGRLPPPPVSSLIGVGDFEIARGRAAVTFQPRKYHYNALGAVHGGVIATVIDIVTGAAVHASLKPGYGFTTLSLEVKYHRAATEAAGPLRAEATVIARGREIVTAEARIADSRARLFATATSTLMIMRAPPAGEPATP